MTTPRSAAATPLKPSWVYACVAGMCGLIIVGSWSMNQYLTGAAPRAAEPATLPVLATVQTDFRGVDRNGEPASFSSLQGRVTVCAFLYTRCPHGCAHVFTTLRALEQRFAPTGNFGLASIAVLPELDTPQILREFAASQGVVDEAPWIFLSGGRREDAWQFMHTQLGLEMTRETAPEDRVSQCDLCDHDLRIVLLDRQHRVRGLYPVMSDHPPTRDRVREQLFADTAWLLASGQ